MNKADKIFLDDKTNKINKKDWIIMGIMAFLYGLLSFYRLGDIKVPTTYKVFKDDSDYEIITLDEEKDVYIMRYYTGNNLGAVEVLSSLDGIEYEPVTTITTYSVFSWQDIVINKTAKYIKLTSIMPNSTLGDIQLYDRNSQKIKNVVNKDSPLFDEVDLVPDEISFLNSTYFDEIYYARSAYEYVHGIDCYEWSHPPLGKLIMAIPILLFGFSPFTYRLMGNIAGILMIPVMYILAKKIFKNRKWAILGASLLLFDNFHFVHTRIALIDSFQVLFILLSFLFMKMYLDIGKKDSFKKKSKYLLLSGFFIGCAIATKWNALYIGLGLAIVFFSHLLKEYKIDLLKEIKRKISLDIILRCISIIFIIPYGLYYLSFLLLGKELSVLLFVYYLIIILIIFIKALKILINDSYLIKLFIISFISFIIIPIVIYVLSYILFPTVSYYDKSLFGIIDISKMMYDYHSNLVATHPFSSEWYQWPVMDKPVWFYVSYTANGLKMTISDIGNIAVWWGGVISFGYLIINAIKNKSSTSKFLLVFIMCSFVPYIFVSRIMFMYHYFITLPFIILGIVSFIKWITEKTKSDKICYCYLAIVIITFIVFYPVVSGLPVSDNYINSLKWLPRWIF